MFDSVQFGFIYAFIRQLSILTIWNEMNRKFLNFSEQQASYKHSFLSGTIWPFTKRCFLLNIFAKYITQEHEHVLQKPARED